MALAPGTRLGVYEVVAPLGAGGMGEVFRARDTRLGRSVALKLLPADLAGDEERRARFEREAKTLATLNHPHIAQIYGVEDVPARDDRPATSALVMELVEGEDLAARIAHGPVPLDEAVPLARQIAEALEAAHEAGIVHRDLKPANIRVTPEGTVKVLDFGLAKALDAPATSTAPGATHSPTLLTSPAMTLHGVILGTAGYMAPEQARGRPVDRRADIWAFGCVLYELLTGRRAFDGEDITEMLAAIVKSEPDWTKLPATTPPRLRTLLQRCLAKDRSQRLQHIGDARLELADDVLDPVATPSLPVPSPRRLPWVWAVAGAAATAATFALWGAASTPPAAPAASSLRAVLDIATDASSDRPELSPDGRHIAYVAASPTGPRGVWVHDLAAGRSAFVAGTERGGAPFWSPDAQQIGFFADDRLKVVPLAGGPARTVCEVQTTARNSGSWHRRGVILFSEDVRRPLFRVAADGGRPEPVTSLTDTELAESDEVMGDYHPRWLPDGDHFLFFRDRASWGIYGGTLSSKIETELLPNLTGAEFVSPWLLWVSEEGTLSARRFDAETLAFDGPARVLANGVDFVAQGYRPLMSATNDVIAWRIARESLNRLVVVDRTGRELRQIGEPGPFADPQVSADGSRLAVEVTTSRAANRKRIEVFPLNTAGPPVSLASGALDEGQAAFSADGRRLVFAVRPRGFPETPTFRMRDLSRPGAGDPLTLRGVIDDWTRDGRYVVTTQLEGTGGRTMWAAELPAGAPISLSADGGDMSQGQVSPDGRWLAFTSADGPLQRVHVQGFPTPGTRQLVSPRGGVQARWSADGRELYFRAPDDTIYAVPIATGSDLSVGEARPLFKLPLAQPNGAGIGTAAQFDVLPNGQFVVNLEVRPQTTSFHVMTNWQAGLR